MVGSYWPSHSDGGEWLARRGDVVFQVWPWSSIRPATGVVNGEGREMLRGFRNIRPEEKLRGFRNDALGRG